MSKGTFFTGQPIFGQLLNLIPRGKVASISRDNKADHYCKSFTTYAHLVTMLYGVFNQCSSLREITTGLLAWEQRLHHLGITKYPRRSTLADANERRSHLVFEKIYLSLVQKYSAFLPDSRKRNKKKNLYLFDSTSISLFADVLKGSGQSKANGRQKGGIKVHTLLRSDLDMPTMIRFSAAAKSDVSFLKKIRLPAGSVLVFDKGYRDYGEYNRLDTEKITWVTRHRDSSTATHISENPITPFHTKQGVLADRHIKLGSNHPNKKGANVMARMIEYQSPKTGKLFTFITNNTLLSPLTIAGYYEQRWQIETFFKRIKQNYPLRFFYGDSPNAIKIQIWCALIADLLLKVIGRASRSSLSHSNIASLTRIHLMTYMNIYKFLRTPEKSLLEKISRSSKSPPQLPLFNT